MLNDSTRKTVFNAKWLFKVICFDVDEKPLGDYVLRHNNFGLYELWKNLETARSKIAIFDDPTFICCPLSNELPRISDNPIPLQSRVSALHFCR